jgi:hypothetical protein
VNRRRKGTQLPRLPTRSSLWTPENQKKTNEPALIPADWTNPPLPQPTSPVLAYSRAARAGGGVRSSCTTPPAPLNNRLPGFGGGGVAEIKAASLEKTAGFAGLQGAAGASRWGMGSKKCPSTAPVNFRPFLGPKAHGKPPNKEAGNPTENTPLSASSPSRCVPSYTAALTKSHWPIGGRVKTRPPALKILTSYLGVDIKVVIAVAFPIITRRSTQNSTN